MKRALSLLLCLMILTATAVPAALASAGDQSDAVQVLGVLGVLNGDPDGNLRLDDAVTRAEFVKMAVALSDPSDIVGARANVSPFKDVPAAYWASGYIRSAVADGWITGYTDGTFRPVKTITLAEGANIALKLLGYVSADFAGTYPSGQMTAYHEAGLDKNITATQTQALTRKDCLYLFYNMLTARTKGGAVYAQTLGYALTAGGQVDTLSLIAANTDGPLVVDPAGQWSSELSFSLGAAKVYYEGALQSADSITPYDLLYYSSKTATIWRYDDKVSGILESVLPDSTNPSSVRVSGITYTLGTREASVAVSYLGTVRTGDPVTLLLGRDGAAAAVLPAGELYYENIGVVTETGTKKTTDAEANVYETDYIRIVDAAGFTHEYVSSTDGLDAGDLVRIAFSDGRIAAVKLSDKPLAGAFSADFQAYAGYTLSENINILDVNSHGGYTAVFPQRLSGLTLDKADVKYYQLDGDGRLDMLILNDYTGDIDLYGVLVNTVNPGESGPGAVFSCDVGGVKYPMTVWSTVIFDEGPCRLSLDNGTPCAIATLAGIRLDSADSLYAYAGGQRLNLASGAPVYELRGGHYYLSGISRVSDLPGYKLIGYYDKPEADGGRIRVIIAQPV